MGNFSLKINTLTAEIARMNLGERGNTIETFALALHDEWTTRTHSAEYDLISTMSNRLNSAPHGETYWNVQLLDPDEKRCPTPSQYPFLRGKPLLCGRLSHEARRYTLETAVLQISLDLYAVMDWQKGTLTFYHRTAEIPASAIATMAGRRLGEIVEIPGMHNAAIRRAYVADRAEMQSVVNHPAGPGLAIVTELPMWSETEFSITRSPTPGVKVVTA